MSARPFDKYEGLGNDFVVVEERHWPLETLTVERVSSLCDRHLGVGADGVLWVGAASEPEARARMIVFNADGSRPEMCGNGLRCVAAHLAEAAGEGAPSSFLVQTDAGSRRVWCERDGAGQPLVEAEMGLARVSTGLDAPVPAGLAAVDVGNPHAVLADPGDDEARRALVESVVGCKGVWPRGVNVEFVEPVAGDAHALRVRVFERGVGWTQACGTGACAAAAAAAVGRGEASARYTIELAGGALRVGLERESEGVLRVLLRGPARRVFAGVVRDA